MADHIKSECNLNTNNVACNLDNNEDSECIPDVVEDIANEDPQSVMDEIARCRRLYEKRQKLKKLKAIDIKPLYYEHKKKRDLIAKYPVDKCWITYPKRKVVPCKHTGKIIIDRDILTKNEHINFLAEPKPCFARKLMCPQRCCIRRYLPNCTTRVVCLSHPMPRRVKNTWEDYHHVLSIRQAMNLRKTLQKPPLDLTSIDNALTYIHEESRLQNVVKKEANRKCNNIKKKLLKVERHQMTNIILALYEIMKEYFTSNQFQMNPDEVNCLSRILERKIAAFCNCDYKNSTSHVRQLLKAFSINLAIWIHKFTSNCGFKNDNVDSEEEEETKDKCKPFEHPEFLLPVEDYISYHSTVSSENMPEEEYDLEDNMFGSAGIDDTNMYYGGE